MRSGKVRRLFAVFLALVLTTGLVTHYVPAGEMGAKTSAVAMDMSADMPMPSKCDGCAGNENALMPAACVAFCSSVVVIPVTSVVAPAVSIGTLWPATVAVATGHIPAPEPYPPRPIVLS